MPESGLRFVKGHGTENDFVLLPDPDGELDLAPGLVRALCDRRAGLGADGVLRVVRSGPSRVASGETTAWFLDYRNADGSVAEMCGNGARVFARYLVAAGLAEPGEFSLATRGGMRLVRVPASGDVSVQMGLVRVGAAASAVVGGRRLSGLAVSVGNPHLVCLGDEPVETFDLSGPPQVDAATFPDGVNLEVARALGERRLQMRVHERGSGETRSCGTGACAVAAVAAVRAGGAGGDWEITVPGGRLTVTLDGGGAWLTGPAVLVAEGTLHPEWLAQR